jgi:hypothetical protein
MAQQTAVEWLYKIYLQTKKIDSFDIEQAKQMEKKQIEVAFSDGQQTPINHPTLPMYSREEYYNDTYGKE